MAYSTQSAVSDGTLSVLPLSIDYLSRDDISVYFGTTKAPSGSWSWVGTTDKTITFAEPVAYGVTVTVKRATKVDELYHRFGGGTQFTAKTLDESLRQTLFVAQEFSEVGGVASDDMPLPVGGQAAPGFSNKFARADHVHVGMTGGAVGSVVLDTFTGDGTTTLFTLTNTPTSKGATQVYVGSAYQEKATYSVTGNKLTFTEAPESGAVIEVVTVTIGGGKASDVQVTETADMLATDTGGNVQGALAWLTGKFKSLAASAGSALVGFIPAGVGGSARTVQAKLRDIPSITDYGAVGDGVTDNYDAINRALAAHNVLYVPPGTFMTSAGSAGKPPHKITGKALVGQSREVSIIQATGTNSARTLFVNDVTDVATPGTWGSGKDFRLEKLWIRGNWDAATGLTSVTEGSATTSVGIQKAQYSAATQSALIKAVSAAYPLVLDCYIDNAWEHGILYYRAGYAEISGNIVARCRGSGIWLTADSAANAVTSTIVERNQIVANRGGWGGLYTTYTYGCAVRDNRPFEDNTWGATFGEGADTDISGNYFEINPFGDAYIDPSLWGLSLLNNYWTIKPTLPSGPAARGFFGYDRKNGLRHLPVGGLGEANSRLGPLSYSPDADVLGVGKGTEVLAGTGTGLKFPTVQNPSTDAYTLDDYAERPVTMTDDSGAGLTFTGSAQMTKVGRMVSVCGYVTFPVTSSTMAVAIGGFPQAGAVDGVGSAVDNAGLGASSVHFPANGTKFLLYPAGSFTNRTNANFSGKVVYFAFTYHAAQ